MTTSMRVASLGLTVTTSSERERVARACVASILQRAAHTYSIHTHASVMPVNHTCPSMANTKKHRHSELSRGPAGVRVNPWG